MPYTEKQRRFFNLCSHNPEAAHGRCPPMDEAKKLAHEANKMVQHHEGASPHESTLNAHKARHGIK